MKILVIEDSRHIYKRIPDLLADSGKYPGLGICPNIAKPMPRTQFARLILADANASLQLRD